MIKIDDEEAARLLNANAKVNVNTNINTNGSHCDKSKSRHLSLTVNHFYTHYTPNERLALHEHALSKAKCIPGYPFDTWSKQAFQASIVDSAHMTQNPVSEAQTQLSSLQADKIRRRPKSYKTSGSVKSYTQELRHLIESQMSLIRPQLELEEINEEESQGRMKQSEKRKGSSSPSAREKHHRHHKQHKSKHKHRHEHKNRSYSRSRSCSRRT
jgi:hypothetical protein